MKTLVCLASCLVASVPLLASRSSGEATPEPAAPTCQPGPACVLDADCVPADCVPADCAPAECVPVECGEDTCVVRVECEGRTCELTLERRGDECVVTSCEGPQE